ncbi:MAG TPA: ABC transporter permease subunit [Alphaproteobacteria bacterium]|nr:ABC transporter permease subunit [Alphaproteobacteria bacterium]
MHYFPSLRLRPSPWDAVAFFVVITIITLLVWGSRKMVIPFTMTDNAPLSLDPINLPYYASQTILRMFYALILSLVFSFVYASIAAKNKKAERILIPLLDILQSVPILGFLSITVTGFIALFPGSLLGVECASIFAIFTSQAWNMTFSLYQSFISVPKELTEVAALYHLSSWHRFWRLKVPYAIPQLLWNTMMSVSGGWFFVVASEAITVSGNTILLPGIGSYIAVASRQKSIESILYAILTMLIVILLYDQLLFRPLLAWCDKFKAELTANSQLPSSWVLTMIRRARLFQFINKILLSFLGVLDRVFQPLSLKVSDVENGNKNIYLLIGKIVAFSIFFLLIFVFIFYGTKAYSYIFSNIYFSEVLHVVFLGSATLIRVVTLCVLASLVWVPVGVMIGLNGRLTSILQPWVQFMAAFPANLFFPIVVVIIVKYDLSPNIWLSPLMILGTQWYILFNVIGGASSIPYDFQELAKNFHVKGWLKWKKLYLPGIAPAYVTGLITAAGGSWNASIVAEYVSWGDKTLEATGVGAYIAANTAAGDHPRILLGVMVLAGFVLMLNRILWHPLYLFATTRYRLD